MEKSLSVHIPAHIYYGKHRLQHIDEILPASSNDLLIVTDKKMIELGKIDELTKLLKKNRRIYTIYSDLAEEPTSDHVKAAVALCEQTKRDCIISFGGGSCIDLAKAVSVLAYSGWNQLDEWEERTFSLPHIAIPTTAGTGSEATDVIVITHSRTREKVMTKHPAFTPYAAIVDPTLTYSCPRSIIAHTGLDAFCHAIESVMSKKTNSFSEKFAWSAIELIIANLEQAYKTEAREAHMDNLALAALEAGIAFSNASVTLIHGMSRPLGALFQIPHGLSNAMLLHVVLQFNKEKITPIMEKIGMMVAKYHPTYRPSDRKKTKTYEELAYTYIDELLRKLSIPTLKTFGIAEEILQENLHKMATEALASGSPQNNPIVPTIEQIKQLYIKAFH